MADDGLRKSLLRIASDLPTGNPTRREILSALKAAGTPLGDVGGLRALRQMIKRNGLQATVVRVGTGRNYEIGLYGRDAARVARSLEENNGLIRTPMSGSGASEFDMITLR